MQGLVLFAGRACYWFAQKLLLLVCLVSAETADVCTPAVLPGRKCLILI